MEVEDGSEEIQMASVLPVARIDKTIRNAFPGKRVSTGTSVYTTAALDAIFSAIVRAADEKRAGSRKGPKGIDRKTLAAAIRMHPELGRLFRSYVFLPSGSIKVKGDMLLTKADKETLKRKRESIAAEKEKRKAVPGVDEE